MSEVCENGSEETAMMPDESIKMQTESAEVSAIETSELVPDTTTTEEANEVAVVEEDIMTTTTTDATSESKEAEQTMEQSEDTRDVEKTSEEVDESNRDKSADGKSKDKSSSKRSKKDSGSEDTSSSKSDKPKRSADATKYWALVDKNRQDFTSWTLLISVVEKEGKMEGMREVYDEFLLYYPFCYGYWKKLADFVADKEGEEAACKVYEEAVVAVGLSIDVWVAYLEFYISKEKTEEEIRGLFERAVATCGLEFKSDKVWDMYIDWETKNGKLVNVTNIYRRLMAIPTKCYTTHNDSVKEHIDKHEPWEILSGDELVEVRLRATNNLAAAKEEEDKDTPPGTAGAEDVAAVEESADNDEAKPADFVSDQLKKGMKEILCAEFEALYTETEKEVKLRWAFEEAIKRPYFHSKPLDSTQLKNWRRYLEFEVANGGEDRAIFLFERCVIACAQYEEFWLKYTTYLEGLNRHTDVRNVYTRACRQHLPYKASIHITWAFYEERQGEFEQALAVITNIELQTTDNMCVLNHKLNLLRRHGDDLTDLYTSYIEKKELCADSVRLLTSKYARYLLKIRGDADKAAEVLNEAITKHPTHEPFYTQLVDVEYQRQPLDEDKVLAVFDLINSSSLSADIKQKFYSRRYEFVDDLGSDVNRLYTLYQEHEESVSSAAKDKKRAYTPTSSDKTPDSKRAKTTTAYANNGTATAPAYHNQQYQQHQHAAYYGGAGGHDWNSYYQQQNMDYSQYGAYGQQQQYQQQGYGGYTGYDYSGYY